MPTSRHWRKKNVRQSLTLPRHPWKPRRRRPITLPMSIETVPAHFTLCFVIKAKPGPGVFATVGRARLLFRSKRAIKRVNRGASIILAGTGGAVAAS